MIFRVSVPPTDPRRQGRVLEWRRRGFYLIADEKAERLEGFVLATHGPHSFTGQWRFGGANLAIHAGTTRSVQPLGVLSAT